MKKLFYFMLMLFTACSNYDEEASPSEGGLTKLEASLNLVAPNGQKIATSINELKKKAQIGDAEIINIEFVEVKKGFIAMVDYLTKDNEVLNFAVYDKTGIFDPGRIKTKGEIDSGETVVYVDCKPKSNSKCKKCRVVIYANTGTIECNCKRPSEVASSECEKIQTIK